MDEARIEELSTALQECAPIPPVSSAAAEGSHALCCPCSKLLMPCAVHRRLQAAQASVEASCESSFACQEGAEQRARELSAALANLEAKAYVTQVRFGPKFETIFDDL